MGEEEEEEDEGEDEDEEEKGGGKEVRPLDHRTIARRQAKESASLSSTPIHPTQSARTSSALFV
eukprot:485360-Hanusia_phi.AAC.3